MNKEEARIADLLADHIGIKLKWTIGHNDDVHCSRRTTNGIEVGFDPYCNSKYKEILRNITKEQRVRVESILSNEVKFIHADSLFRSWWVVDYEREIVVSAIVKVLEEDNG